MQFPYFHGAKVLKHLEGVNIFYESRFSNLFHHFGVPKLHLKGKAKFGLLTTTHEFVENTRMTRIFPSNYSSRELMSCLTNPLLYVFCKKRKLNCLQKFRVTPAGNITSVQLFLRRESKASFGEQAIAETIEEKTITEKKVDMTHEKFKHTKKNTVFYKT